MSSTQNESGHVKTRSRKRASIRRRRWRHGLAVGIITGLIGAIFALTPLGDRFEQSIGLTWLFYIRGPIKPPPDVAIVGISSRTAENLNLPALPRNWPRAIHGELIKKLIEQGASTIVFDLDFQHARDAENDRELARAIAGSKRVALFEHLTGRWQPILDREGRQTGTVWTEEVVPPIPELVKATKGMGPFPLPKIDVDVSQFWAFKHSVGDVPTLPMIALQMHALGVYDKWLNLLKQAGIRNVAVLPPSSKEILSADSLTQMMVVLRRQFLQDLTLAGRLNEILRNSHDYINENERKLLQSLIYLYGQSGDRYLNFYGPPGSITNIPYDAVIKGGDPNIDPALLNFKNKVVFVGYSDLFDPGQPDRYFTVFSGKNGVDLSGVEIMATAYANTLTSRSLRPSDTVVTAAISFAFGLLFGSGLYLLAALAAVPLAILLSGLYIASVQYAFNDADMWMPLAIPILVQLPLAVFVGLMAQYLLERLRRKKFSKAVSYYLPDYVVRELTDKVLDPSELNRVVYGICFATDMSGFTSISQSLDPSELAKFMNSYFDALAAALKRHNVSVTEFHADTIMCAWTAESPETLSRRDAPLAALATLEAVQIFNSQRKDVHLNARVGLDEGRFYLGHTGGGGRMGYSILGDCANTAARLESLNKHLKTHILASVAVVGNADHLLLRSVGEFVLVGKSDPLPVYEVVAEQKSATAQQHTLCDRFAEAFETFRNKQWVKAMNQFEAILQDFPEDGPTMFHLRRCQQFQAGSVHVDDPIVVMMDAK